MSDTEAKRPTGYIFRLARDIRERLLELEKVGPHPPVYGEIIPDEGFTQYDTATLHLVADVLEDRIQCAPEHISRLRSIASRITATLESSRYECPDCQDKFSQCRCGVNYCVPVVESSSFGEPEG